MKKNMDKNEGSVGEFLVTGLCVLSMAAVMIVFLRCTGLIQQKLQASQLARKYLLKMETCGCLLSEDYSALLAELGGMGVSETDLTGTSFTPVGYGNVIELRIRGKLKGEYDFVEYRTSTAKY